MSVKCILTGQTPDINDIGAQSKITASGILKGDGNGNVTAAVEGTDYLTEAPVTSINSKTGVVELTASDVGALPDSTVIPSKTSDLTNDSGFITANIIPVKSVAGKTGTVTLAKNDVGLGNVDNTSDANKPISTATQAALDGKQVSITVSGILKGDGAGGITAAVEGTDYISSASGKKGQYLGFTADNTLGAVSLPNAGTGTKGITYLVDSYERTDTDKAVTPKALNNVYKMVNNKQDKITAEGLLKGDGSGGITVATAGTDYLVTAPVTSVNGKTGAVTIDIPSIPIALPNPNALNIKVGNTTTTYDGSAVKTVEIPTKTSELSNDSKFITFTELGDIDNIVIADEVSY